MIAKAHQRVNGYLPASAYNQVDRILISDKGFYYKTADGTAEGPFATEGEAMYEFNNYIRVSTLQKELDVKKRGRGNSNGNAIRQLTDSHAGDSGRRVRG